MNVWSGFFVWFGSLVSIGSLVSASHSLKIVSLQPGGLNGFYMYGISKFIKQNYDLDDATYYGSSAGAWNALYLSENGKKEKGPSLETYLEELDVSGFSNLYDIEHSIKQFYLQHYSKDDFNLHQLNICVSQIKQFGIEKKIYSGFIDLEDTLECCMASSHIPIITNNNLFFEYKNKLCVDGGVFPFPHPENVEPNLIIYPHMWDNLNIRNKVNMRTFNISQNILWGYQDACLHQAELDNALL